MLKRTKKFCTKNFSVGQSMMEYVLVFTGVVFALIIALGPTGFLTRKIGDTMNLAMVGTKCVVLQTCFDPAGCPTVCGNDCCEPGESISTCPADCSLCMSDADCDDGIACTGIEVCDPVSGCQPGVFICGNCTGPDGSTIVHGGSKTYYESAAPPFESNCVSESRLCFDGILSGSYTEASCSVSAPADCGSVPHGGSATFYQSATVPCGDSCIWELRMCDDGVLSGSYTKTSCMEVCTDCTGPDGAFIANGESRIYYLAEQEECWTLCVDEARLCTDGVLGGSFTAPDCFVTDCDDGVFCTEDICIDNRYDTWGCVTQPHHERCDDFASCTGAEAVGDNWICGELCSPDLDVPAWEIDDDWCDVMLDCQFNPRHDECNDGMSCSNDWCAPVYAFPGYATQVPPIDAYEDCSVAPTDGECEGDLDGTTGCVFYLDHTSCDDTVGCTWNWCDPQEQDGGTPIDANGCWYDPDNANCGDGIDCTFDWCHLTDDCQYQPDHGSCNDGAVCTGATVAGPDWEGGDVTVPGWAIGEDWCDVELGCQFNPRHDECDDGMSCSSDYCAPVYVFPGYATQVPPIDAYEDCSVAPTVGECEGDLDGITTGCVFYLDHTSCDDAVGCTWNWCDPQEQDGGTPIDANGCWFDPDNANCGDGIGCTIDWCHLTDDCQYQPDHDSCNDGVVCTGAMVAGPDWEGGDVTVPGWAIGEDWCDVIAGCQFDPHDEWCDDEVGCTDDWCHLTNDCQFDPNDANCPGDGVGCTDDYCDAVLDCQAPANDANCPDDGVSCTDDYCDTVLDCQYPPNDANCDDGVSCTDDYCDAVLDCQAPANDANCDDMVGCTDDYCDAVLDCQAPANDANCPSDGVGCTDDYCDAVLDCQYPANDANCPGDGVGCTDDYCDAVLGCQASANNANCDDGVSCTMNFCDPVKDCQYLPVFSLCSDNNVCTGIETCDVVLGCQAGIPLVCNDGNVCDGIETCNAVLGCQAGIPLNCNDGNPLTIDSCNPLTGCVHTPTGGKWVRIGQCFGSRCLCFGSSCPMYPRCEGSCISFGTCQKGSCAPIGSRCTQCCASTSIFYTVCQCQ